MVANTSSEDLSKNNPFFLIDPYRDFLRDEGIPVVEQYSVNVFELELEPWKRLGGLGSYVHLEGRGDFCNCYVVMIPAGEQLNSEISPSELVTTIAALAKRFDRSDSRPDPS